MSHISRGKAIITNLISGLTKKDIEQTYVTLNE